MCHTPQTTDADTGNTLDFKVFIKQKFLDQGICSFSSLDKIVRQCDIDDMLIDPTLEVPDV